MPSSPKILSLALLVAALAACAKVHTDPAGAPTPAAAAPAGAAQIVPAIPAPPGYRLVWADEFTKDGPLDDAHWGYEEGFVRNNELQWYQRQNAVCKDGMLVIEARKERKPNPRYVAPVAPPQAAPATQPQTTQSATQPTTQPGRGSGRGRGAAPEWYRTPFATRRTIEYTAASVNTRGKHSWLYGRFEIRCKINIRSGSWPAFWSLGIQGGWPANGEIDIMEFYRGMLLFNVAWGGANGPIWNSVRRPTTELPAGWENEFHTWRMDWDDKFIKLYLDDVLVNTQDLAATTNVTRGGGRGRGNPPLENPFHGPAYILVNQALGGDNGGDPAGTEFPIRFEVDYVRVFQTAEQEAATTAALARFNALPGRGRGGPATTPTTSPTTVPARGG